jgi:hypothetical protein
LARHLPSMRGRAASPGVTAAPTATASPAAAAVPPPQGTTAVYPSDDLVRD